MRDQISNLDIVTLAVFLSGGEALPIDTEDVAVKANEIAPGRFSWRKYPNQINLDAVRKRLWDATKAEKGHYLVGSERRGWSLTLEGIERARELEEAIPEADVSRTPMTRTEQKQRRLEQERMLGSEAYRIASEKGPEFVSLRDAEIFFRLNDYVVGMARERRLNRALAVYGDDPELGTIVRVLAAQVMADGRSNE